MSETIPQITKSAEIGCINHSQFLVVYYCFTHIITVHHGNMFQECNGDGWWIGIEWWFSLGNSYDSHQFGVALTQDQP